MREESVGVDDLRPPLRRAVDAAFDRDPEAVERATDSGHPGNEVLRVAPANGSGAAYLKVATDDWGYERVARETAVLRSLDGRVPLRTPSVVAASGAGGDAPPFLATASLRGTALVDRFTGGVDPETLATVLRETGRAMARLHAVELPGPGTVAGDGDGDGDGEGTLPVDHRRWADVLRETAVEASPTPERVPELPARTAALLRERAADLRPERVTVVHGDLTPRNLLAGGEREIEADGDGHPPGVLDFESALAGDPAFDLARTVATTVDGRPDLDRATREHARAALLSGYRAGAAACDTPTDGEGLPPGYRQRRPVYRVVTFCQTVLTFEHWAAETGGDELLDWTREEFDRRLRAARASETGG